MIERSFQNEMLPLLGFGLMRLPKTADGEIDMVTFREMVDYALKHGIRYFDTAVPYHNGMSEVAIGEILSDYPRDSFFLADKYPGHQKADTYDASVYFESSLKKCKVDYFDYYLLHNVTESTIPVYESEEWNIIPYLLKQKEAGRIKHLGFSSHARPENLRAFLTFCKEHDYPMEFCQIQLNYLDWSLQDAEEKVNILREFNIPIWVMEPIRGGRLKDDVRSAFRFVMSIPEVKMILSGMSDMNQLTENIKIFEKEDPLTKEETANLLQKAEQLKNGVPCTACRYCVEGCPMNLQIPDLMKAYNELKVEESGFTPMMYLEGLTPEERPHACIGCGACTHICPQNIPIPLVMKELASLYDRGEKWSDICRKRAEAEKKLK